MKKLNSILASLTLASALARGQEAKPIEGPPMTLGISPLRAELKMGAGIETTQAVRISNTGQVATQIRVTLSDWTLSPSGEQQFVKMGSGTWGCGAWLKANPLEFSLAPGATELVRYTMKAPASIPEGGYHCAVVFDTLPPPREQLAAGTGVVNLVRLVTTLYVGIGNPPIVAKVKRLEVVPHTAGKKTTYEILTTFGNEGTTQYRVNGTLELTDSAGQVVHKFEYRSFPVLPLVDRVERFRLDEPLAPGAYKVRAVVDVGLSERLAAETKLTVEGS